VYCKSCLFIQAYNEMKCDLKGACFLKIGWFLSFHCAALDFVCVLILQISLMSKMNVLHKLKVETVQCAIINFRNRSED